MALRPTAWLDSNQYDASEDREILRNLVRAAGGVEEGVCGSADYAVSQRAAGANMSVDVAAGSCFVKADTGTFNGSYFQQNDGVVNVTVPAADLSNPRLDLIVMEIEDANDLGDDTNTPNLRLVQGTAAGSPVDPATPDNALVLARVAVAAAAASIVTANITDLRPVLGTAAPKQARAYGTGTTTIAVAGTWYSVALNNERFDNDAIHDTATNNSRLTCKTAGLYLIGGHIAFDNNGTYGYVRIALNGATSIGRSMAADTNALSITSAYQLAVNDYVELQVTHNTAGRVVTVTPNESPEFWMTRLGASG